jgi:hypothetical protein
MHSDTPYRGTPIAPGLIPTRRVGVVAELQVHSLDVSLG